MAIFNSYVSLPEGIGFGQKCPSWWSWKGEAMANNIHQHMRMWTIPIQGKKGSHSTTTRKIYPLAIKHGNEQFPIYKCRVVPQWAKSRLVGANKIFISPIMVFVGDTSIVNGTITHLYITGGNQWGTILWSSNEIPHFFSEIHQQAT